MICENCINFYVKIIVSSIFIFSENAMNCAIIITVQIWGLYFMANVDISVIIPSKNNKNFTAEIIKKTAEETKNIEVEFIVIDMNSTDNSILSALKTIKDSNLRGCVIQSGGSTMSSALNTGIFKSDGKYITFLYPKRLYKKYICDYYNTIEKENGDFVFSVPSSEKKYPDPSASELNNISGTELITNIINSTVDIDFSAVMIKREFLLSNHIRFYEDCNYGYAEAFIFNTLLFNPKIVYANINLERNYIKDLNKDENLPATNNNCFERVEAMIKVLETAGLNHKDNTRLISAFEYQKIPSAVMLCIDILLNEGFSYIAIKNSLHSKGYDELLKTSKLTPAKLKRRIIKWKTVPWLYKPKK